MNLIVVFQITFYSPCYESLVIMSIHNDNCIDAMISNTDILSKYVELSVLGAGNQFSLKMFS